MKSVELLEWFICSACSRVNREPTLQHSGIDQPAPCCGVKSFRNLWPETGHRPLDLVFGLDVTSHDELRVACVFLCAALEAILERSLWFVLGRMQTPGRVATALMDANDGRARLLKLWTSLLGASPQRALDASGNAKWYADWERLVTARNDVGHGSWDSLRVTEPLDQLVVRARDGALTSMAALHNAAVDALDRMSFPPRRLHAFVVDLGGNTPKDLGDGDEYAWPQFITYAWKEGEQAQTYHCAPVDRHGTNAFLYVHCAEPDRGPGAGRVDLVLQRLQGFARRQYAR